MHTEVSAHLEGGEKVERATIFERPDKGVVRIGDVTIFGTIAQLDALLDDLAALRSDEAAK